MVVTPKFITTSVVSTAVDAAIRVTFDNPALSPLLNKQMGHLVVIVPGEERNAEHLPTHTVPVVFYERSIGDKAAWTNAYDRIARSKAMQLWNGQNEDGRTDSHPHLLYRGDTPYWGGVERRGIIVAFSGVQPYFDQMISGMVADMIIALARHEWEQSDDKKERRAFIS